MLEFLHRWAFLQDIDVVFLEKGVMESWSQIL
jgi:hypothetical protein